MQSTLSKQQQLLLIELIKNDTLLLQQYEYLITMEHKNIHIVEYQTVIEEITKYVCEENALFANLNITKAQYCDAITFLENYGEYLPPNIVDDLIYEEGATSLIKRLIGKIKENIVNDKDFFALDKEIGMSDVSNEQNIADMFDQTHNMIIVKNAIQMDALRLLLIFIEQELQNPDNQDIRYTLIRAKYKLIFLTPDIEADMISNNFEVNESIYLSAKMLSDSIKLHPECFELVRDNFVDDLTAGELEKLLVFSDNDLIRTDDKLEILLRLRYLKAGLILGTDEESNELYDIYKTIIEDELTEESPYLKEKISGTFDDAPTERAKHKILSLFI